MISLQRIFFPILFALTFFALDAYAGSALRFNVDDATRVTIPDSETMDIDGETITMEAWINLPNPQADIENTIVNKENSYELHVRNGLFQVAIQTNNAWAWVGANSRIEANRWYHVAATYDGRNIRVYVDGDLRSINAKNGRIDPRDDPFYIGIRPLNDFAYGLTGQIDEVRVWNVTRTEEELNANMNLMLDGNEEGLVGYWRLDEGEGQEILDKSPNANHGFAGAEEGEDENDPEWIESDAPIRGGEILLDRETLAFLPLPVGESAQEILLISNISDVEDDAFIVEYGFDHEGDQPDWLTINPEEGQIPPRESVEITFTINTDRMEIGFYEHSLELITTSSNMRTTELPITISVVEGAGRLFGRVTDAETGDAVAGVRVNIVAEFDQWLTTNENGEYDFDPMPAFNYHVQVIAPDYLPWNNEEVSVENGQARELNIELLHSEFSPDPQVIELAMQPDDTLTIPLTITNDGNGSLTWQVERVFPDEMQIEPWEHRWSSPVAEILENDRMGAVEYVNGLFYVAGGFRNEDNLIYVMTREGELLRQFTQFAESGYGFRDLTWDGELLWGYDEGQIFGFTTNGELVQQFDSPVNPARAISWDPDRDLLWICNTTTAITGIDRRGEVQMNLDRPGGDLHVYGLGYQPEDADGFCLYMFCGDGELRRQIYKMDINTGEVQFLIEPDIEGQAGALTVSGTWDPYSWVLIGLTRSNPDAIEIWQLDARTNWLTLSEQSGSIPPNQSATIGVLMNSLGLPIEEVFTADLHFTYDGVGGESNIPVALTITGEGGVSQRVLNLNLGSNLVSINVAPVDMSFGDIIAPLEEAGTLILAKDEFGRFYIPEGGFPGLDEWNPLEGYYLKVLQPISLRVEGEVIPRDTPVPVENGWNMVSYLPRASVDPATALEDLGEALTIVKNIAGQFYIPEWEFSNIGLMREGQGYLMKVEGDAEFVYNLAGGNVATYQHHTPEDLGWLAEVPVGLNSFSLIVKAQGILPAGTRLEAYTPSGILAGRGIVRSDGFAGMALWGDDPTTKTVEGFNSGDRIALFADSELSCSCLDGDAQIWAEDGWGVLSVNSEDLPVEFGLTSAYPNPFNGQLRIEFACASTGPLALSVYDLNGRLVNHILTGEQATGTHSLTWNADNQPSGVYLVRISQNNQSESMKVILMR